MAGRGRGGLLLVLAALAIVFGTAAMVLSRGDRPRRLSPVERLPAGGRTAAARSDPAAAPSPGPHRSIPSDGKTALVVRVLRLPERVAVPGAEVLLQDEGGVWRAVADGNGEAVFEVVARRPVILVARAPGLVGLPQVATASFVDAPPTEIGLAVVGGLHGVVRSKATREPIAGARVALAAQVATLLNAGFWLEPAEELRAPATQATTGPDGRFSVTGLPEGIGCTLTASHAGFADGTINGLCPDGEGNGPDLEVLLEPGGRIVGTVRDRAGNPLEGALVAADRSAAGVPGGPPWTLKRAAPPTYRIWVDGRPLVQSWGTDPPPPRPGFRAVTGPDGSFALEGLPLGGTWFVGAWLQGFATVGGPTKVEWPPDAPEVRCDLVLDRAGEILVDWTSADRRLPERALVTVAMSGGSEGAGRWADFRRGGRIPGIPPGRYLVSVLAGQVGQGSEEVHVVGGGTIDVSIPLSLGDGIEGVVVDSGGSPVARAQVTLDALVSTLEKGPTAEAAATRVLPRGGRFEVPFDNLGVPLSGSTPGFWPVHLIAGGRGQVLTDSQGRFRLLGLVAGDAWRLRVECNGYASAAAGPVEVPASGVRVELPAAGAVVGRLVLPPGEEARSGVSFYYRSDAEAAGRAPSPPDSLRARASFGTGAFRVEGLPPGPGRLLVRVEDRGPFAAVAIDVPAGGTVDAGEVRLGEGFLLRGQVVDAAGRPVEDARVYFHATGVRDRTATTSAGTFVLEHLPECEGELEVRPPPPPRHLPRGAVEVVLFSPQVPDAVVVRVRVAVWRDAPPVAVALPATGVLDGTALDAKGAPLPGCRVSATAADPAPGAVPLEMHAGPDGRFHARLPAGEYHIVIHSRTPPWAPLAEADAVVPADGVVSLELRAKE